MTSGLEGKHKSEKADAILKPQILELIDKLADTDIAKLNDGWVKSAWILGAINVPFGPSELFPIARALEKNKKIRIKRNKDQKRREETRAVPRPFECKKINKRAKKKTRRRRNEAVS